MELLFEDVWGGVDLMLKPRLADDSGNSTARCVR